jgi:ABC-type dipeptide/oligopeptide/nickel transport system permease component
MLLQGGVTLIAVAYVAINLAVDMLYAVLDPRVGHTARARS